MSSFRDIFVNAAADVADEFYPKGDKRRGEFLRDQAMIYVKLLEHLSKEGIGGIGAEMAGQDNRATQNVMFVIEQDVDKYVEPGDDWTHRRRVEEPIADRLCDDCKVLFDNDKELPEDCSWCDDYAFDHFKVEKEFVLGPGLFFTEKAARDHIASNDYHYNNPSVYGVGAWRNYELQATQRLLIELSGNDLPSHYK